MARRTIVIWGATGGVGTSVVATMLAHQHPGQVTLIDLVGDLNRLLALPGTSGGVTDLAHRPDLDTTELIDTTRIDIGSRVSLVPFGNPDRNGSAIGDGPLDDLSEWIRTEPDVVILHVGIGPPPKGLLDFADESLAVTRLTRVNAERLRRARGSSTGLIVVEHPDSWLTRSDIATLAAVPIYATLPYCKDIPHAIDSGVFIERLDDLARLTALPEIEEQIYLSWPEEAYVTNVADYWLDENGIAGFESYDGDVIVVGQEIWTMSILDRPWSTFEMRIDAEPNPKHTRQRQIDDLIAHPRPPDRGAVTLDEWMLRTSDRLSIDVDFGHAWQSTLSEDRWRLSWNSGSGELHTVNQKTRIVTVLGTFIQEHEVHAALDGWARHHDDANGLDWVDAAIRVAITERRLSSHVRDHRLGAPRPTL